MIILSNIIIFKKAYKKDILSKARIYNITLIKNNLLNIKYLLKPKNFKVFV